MFALAGRIPALYVAALGTLKNTSVFCPMLSFRSRACSSANAARERESLVTTERLYRRTVANLRHELQNCDTC